jgi:hypothetical protein
MCGHPFLLENLPPTDSTPPADYLPYLTLLRELLREHADQILPHPITISVKPGDLVHLKGYSTFSTGTLMDQPSFGHSHDTHCCQAQWDPPVAAPLKEQLEKMENPLGNNISQWFSWLMPILMPIFLVLIFLSFLLCIIKTVQRFLLDRHVCYC